MLRQQLWIGLKRFLIYSVALLGGSSLILNSLVWTGLNRHGEIFYNIQLIIIIFIIYLSIHFFEKRPLISLGLHWRSIPVWLPLGLFMGVSTYITTSSFVFFVDLHLPLTWNLYQLPWQDQKTWGDFLNQTQDFTRAPFLEELWFRGYWFQAWEGAVTGLWGKFLAFGTTTTIFAYWHAYQGLFGVLRTWLFALSASTAYVKTRSLWLPIGLHMGWNLMAQLNYSWEVISNFVWQHSNVSQITQGVEMLNERWSQSPYSLAGDLLLLLLVLVLPLRPFPKDKQLWQRYLSLQPRLLHQMETSNHQGNSTP